MSMSEIKVDTWMPLYVSDYLSDTSHLSTEEHGAYLLLLMHAWVNGGELPIDDNRLRRIARMDEKPWKASRDEIKSFFYEHDGVLRHARVDRELQRAQQHVNQRSAAGKASAAKRKAERDTQRNGNDRSTSVATGDERDTQRNGKPSPSPTPVNLGVIASGVNSTEVAREDENRLAPESADLSPVARVCLGLKSMGYSDTNPHDAKLSALLEAGLTPEEILASGHSGKGNGKGFRWVLAAAEGRRREAANVKPMPAKAAAGKLSQAGQNTAAAVARWLESEGVKA